MFDLRIVGLLVMVSGLANGWAATARAQEAPVQPTAEVAPASEQSNGEKKANLKRLLDERSQAVLRLSDRAGLPLVLDYAQIGVVGVAGIATGVGLGGSLANNSGLQVGGYGCAGCSWLGVVGIILTKMMVDHRAEDAAAIEDAQKRIDEAAMAF